MKILYELISVVFFILISSFSLIAIEFNPWDLPINQRVLDRKTISHLVVDPRRDEYRLVLITSERFPYNYKSTSTEFFFRLKTEKEANQLIHKLDEYLESGQQLTIKLSGSEIKGVIFHEPYEKLP